MNLEEFQGLENDKKFEAIFKSTESTRRYFKWTLIISLVFILLPIIALLFAVPQFLSVYDFGALGL